MTFIEIITKNNYFSHIRSYISKTVLKSFSDLLVCAAHVIDEILSTPAITSFVTFKHTIQKLFNRFVIYFW